MTMALNCNGRTYFLYFRYRQGGVRMYKLLMSEWLLFGGIVLLMLLSIICQLMLIYHMVKLVKESESLEESEPQIMGPWIEEYLMEAKKITNISVFVDKKIQQICIGKMTLIRWKHTSGQLLLAMVFLSGCGACMGIIRGKTLGDILPYYIVSLLGVYIYISLLNTPSISFYLLYFKRCFYP